MRSGPDLIQIIRNSLEMNEIQVGQKPTCLILDEVDGALGGGEGDGQPKGIKMVSDFIAKCIKSSAKRKVAKHSEDEM